jgi:hypothetical protein
MKLEFKTSPMTKEIFFGQLFQIRNQAHLAHLNAKSYSVHIALGSFYEDLLELTDTVIESTQGKYGLLTISIPEAKLEDPLILLTKLVGLTDLGRAYTMFSESWIQNQIDEISTLTYQTLYKLKNLK